MSDSERRDGIRCGPARWSGEACRQAFEEASVRHRWTVGFRSFDALRIETQDLLMEGAWPESVKGVFYRNGPGRHEVGGQRYAHRWDGDGLVQAFDFRGPRPAHRAAYVRTNKLQAELEAGRMLFSAFGTKLAGCDPLACPLDRMNAANISVLPLGRELLALWEPGSAYSLDPDTLQTRGLKSFGAQVDGLAFSAHPKVEPDGTIWNFGTHPLEGALHVYRLDAAGRLQLHRRLQVDPLPPAHDFAVTRRHLVFLLPPLIVSAQRLQSGQASFAEACTWQPQLGLRVLLVSKEDFSLRQFELPAGNLFHVANAWEDRDGTVRLDMMRSDTPRSLIAGWTVMRGDYRHAPGAFLTRVELRPDGRAVQCIVDSVEGEFPAVDPCRVGERHERVLCVARSANRPSDVVGYDEIVLFDTDTGARTRYAYGEDYLVEEHLFVPDDRDPAGPARWIIGTALDMRQRRTVCSLFEAGDIAGGPVSQVQLPYAMPLGLHGAYAVTVCRP